MPNHLYVDYSNVWIEGMHRSAVARGLAPDITAAQRHRICDPRWRLDFARLYQFAGGSPHDVGRAVLYASGSGSRSVWHAARRAGFDISLHSRNGHNREKEVDVQLAIDLLGESYERMNPRCDEITLVAGDRDYVPVVRKVRNRGFPCHVVFWSHAARELRGIATTFCSLDSYIEFIGPTVDDPHRSGAAEVP